MSRVPTDEIRALLLELLCERIYPRYPELVRNDAKTARIVCAYIGEIYIFFLENYRKSPTKLTRKEYEAVVLGRHYEALAGLQEESMRKHIRGLWASGQLPARLKFDVVK